MQVNCQASYSHSSSISSYSVLCITMQEQLEGPGVHFFRIGFMQKYTPLRRPAAKKWKCSRKVNHKITFEVPSAREGWVVVLNLKTFTHDGWWLLGVNIFLL